MSSKITSIAKDILSKYSASNIEFNIDSSQLPSKGEYRRSEYHLTIGKLNPAGKMFMYEGADRDILIENYLGHVESVNSLSDIEDIIKTPKKVFIVRTRKNEQRF